MDILRYLLVIAIIYLGGRLAQKIKMPAILGWLLTGILLGPNVFNLMNNSIMTASWYGFLMLFVQVSVGGLLGNNLNIARLKQSGKQVFTVAMSEIVTTFLMVTLVFGVIFYFMDIPVYLASLVGVIGMSTAPAPPISISQEYKTDGPVTEMLSPLIVMDSILVSAIFFTYVTVLESFWTTEDFSVIALLIMMLVIPIVLGLILGWLAKFLIKKDHSKATNQVIFVIYSILAVLLAYFVDRQVYPGPHMNFILFGMGYMAGVVNSIDNETKKAVGKAAGKIFQYGLLLLILNLSAPLDPKSLLSAGLMVLIYVAVRFFGKWFGVFVSAKKLKLDPKVQKYSGITLWPHAGQSIMLAGIAASAAILVSEAAAEFIMTLIPAGAIISEIIGIIASKKAYDLAGEIGQAKDSER